MTNFDLILLVLLSMALQAAVIFGTLHLFGDRFDSKHPFSISEGSKRQLFLGVPAIGFGILMCSGRAIAHLVGEKAYPYVYFGSMILLILGGMILYNIVPKRLAVPLGIAGWITTFTFWYFWFGPGALVHHAL